MEIEFIVKDCSAITVTAPYNVRYCTVRILVRMCQLPCVMATKSYWDEQSLHCNCTKK